MVPYLPESNSNTTDSMVMRPTLQAREKGKVDALFQVVHNRLSTFLICRLHTTTEEYQARPVVEILH